MIVCSEIMYSNSVAHCQKSMQYNRISIYDEGVFTTMASHKYVHTVSTVSVAVARATLTVFAENIQ